MTAPSMSCAHARPVGVQMVAASKAARINFSMVRPSHGTGAAHIAMVNGTLPVRPPAFIALPLVKSPMMDSGACDESFCVPDYGVFSGTRSLKCETAS